MKKDIIDKMFEGRWRVYGFRDGQNIKQICREFFEAGLALQIDDPSIAMDGFDEFWELYDKKVAKPKCMKLWEKLTNREKADCLEYIPLYKEAQPDKQYRKNPETFLRNKSWNDELIYRNNGQSTKQGQLDKLANVLVD